METKKYKFKRFYFITTYAVIALVSIALGIGFVIAEHKSYRNSIISNRDSLIASRKDTLKTLINSIAQLITYHIKSAAAETKDRITNRLNTAYSVALTIANSDIDESLKKKQIISVLSKMVFGHNYVFVIDTSGNILSSPLTPSLNGKNYKNITNKKIAKSIEQSLILLKDKSEVMYTSAWTKPGERDPRIHRKYVYLKKLKKMDMIIGYGEYEDDFQREIQKNVVKQIENIHLEHDGYIFASTWHGISLTKPAKGKNAYNVKDKDGKYLVRDMISMSRHGGGFIEYTMPPFKGIEQERKISYIAGLPQWQWYIGSGVYVADIDKDFAKNIKNARHQVMKEIIFVIIFLTTILLISAIITKMLSNRLTYLINKYNEAVSDKNLQLEELNKSLEQKVNEKTYELKAINSSLEERIRLEVEKNREHEHIMFQQGRLASMGEMLSNIAHQWRQPLNNLGLYLQDLPEAFDNKELTKDYLDNSIDNCMLIIQHMSGTIDNFRDFFKPNKEKTYFNIDSQITQCVSLVRAGLENNNISIITELNAPNSVYGVPGEYSQVIVNIISNAKDSLLDNKLKNPFIKITTNSVHGHATVMIEDNGGGIVQEIADKVFEPYFTTKGDVKGTGIGLYFSKMIIEKTMGGTIWFENTGSGVVFIVSVPEFINS